MDADNLDFLSDKKKKVDFQKDIQINIDKKTDDEKIVIIEDLFKKIMIELGLDLNDDSLSGTPRRVAKMYVKEIFSGLNVQNKPKVSLFDNHFEYQKILLQKNIELTSTCEHHFLPFTGKAHIGYIANDKIIGLSKLNRVVNYFSKKPQVQEKLTKEIFVELRNILKTDSVIVYIHANHSCVSCRGIKDNSSSTVSMEYGGDFQQKSMRKEFFDMVL
tara:strand:+ start:1652 stop:2302 length:651 start_codon:yes stop_codon:yes gene_type:complete